MDDVKPLIDNVHWLSGEDKQKIFEDNTKKLFRLNLTGAAV